MSIWPLIEKGEFSTISEGVTEADAAILSGKWADYMESVTEKLPTQFGTIGRYAAVTRDTALFKGMARMTQYGDFLAKAILYEHQVKTEKKTPEAALKLVTDEFVNYNLLPGRTRSYLEQMGLTWFWAYKIRSIKVALRMMRDRPARALLRAVDRISRPKQDRGEDALPQGLWRTHQRKRPRPPNRRNPDPRRSHKPLLRPRHARSSATAVAAGEWASLVSGVCCATTPLGCSLAICTKFTILVRVLAIFGPGNSF